MSTLHRLTSNNTWYSSKKKRGSINIPLESCSVLSLFDESALTAEMILDLALHPGVASSFSIHKDLSGVGITDHKSTGTQAFVDQIVKQLQEEKASNPITGFALVLKGKRVQKTIGFPGVVLNGSEPLDPFSPLGMSHISATLSVLCGFLIGGLRVELTERAMQFLSHNSAVPAQMKLVPSIEGVSNLLGKKIDKSGAPIDWAMSSLYSNMIFDSEMEGDANLSFALLAIHGGPIISGSCVVRDKSQEIALTCGTRLRFLSGSSELKNTDKWKSALSEHALRVSETLSLTDRTELDPLLLKGDPDSVVIGHVREFFLPNAAGSRYYVTIGRNHSGYRLSPYITCGPVVLAQFAWPVGVDGRTLVRVKDYSSGQKFLDSNGGSNTEILTREGRKNYLHRWIVDWYLLNGGYSAADALRDMIGYRSDWTLFCDDVINRTIDNLHVNGNYISTDLVFSCRGVWHKIYLLSNGQSTYHNFTMYGTFDMEGSGKGIGRWMDGSDIDWKVAAERMAQAVYNLERTQNVERASVDNVLADTSLLPLLYSCDAYGTTDYKTVRIDMAQAVVGAIQTETSSSGGNVMAFGDDLLNDTEVAAAGILGFGAIEADEIEGVDIIDIINSSRINSIKALVTLLLKSQPTLRLGRAEIANLPLLPRFSDSYVSSEFEYNFEAGVDTWYRVSDAAGGRVSALAACAGAGRRAPFVTIDKNGHYRPHYASDTHRENDVPAIKPFSGLLQLELLNAVMCKTDLVELAIAAGAEAHLHRLLATGRCMQIEDISAFGLLNMTAQNASTVANHNRNNKDVNLGASLSSGTQGILFI